MSKKTTTKSSKQADVAFEQGPLDHEPIDTALLFPPEDLPGKTSPPPNAPGKKPVIDTEPPAPESYELTVSTTRPGGDYDRDEVTEEITFWSMRPDVTYEQAQSEGLLHRLDGPAEIIDIRYKSHNFYEREENWYRHGTLHREGGPACTTDRRDRARDGSVLTYRTAAWYFEGELHRDDGPAETQASRNMICPGYTSRNEWWYRHGKLHRESGPAHTMHVEKGAKYCEGWDIRERWYIDDVLHRLDGPAVIFDQMDRWDKGRRSEVWYQHGRKHREDGPAEARVGTHRAADGEVKTYPKKGRSTEWFLNDIGMTEAEWQKRVKRK